MSNLNNPFTGSNVEVTTRITEEDLSKIPGHLEGFKIIGYEIEDQNERYLLYTNGTLVRKTKSEIKYFK